MMINFRKSTAIAVAVLAISSAAKAHVDCTKDLNRMGSIQANMAFCLNNGLPGSSLIIQGRYEKGYEPAVKQGFEICQAGRSGYQDATICDEASFWVASHTVLPGRATQRIGVNAALNGWQGPLRLFPGVNEVIVERTWKSDRGRPAHGPTGSGSAGPNGFPQGALLWSLPGTIDPQFFTKFPVELNGPADIYFAINDDNKVDNSGYLEVQARQK